MILLLSVAAGLVMRAAVGNPLRGLANVRLKGESFLLLLMLAQLIGPTVTLRGGASKVAFVLWTATFPALLIVAWMNRREPGLWMVALGLCLNMIVIMANGGMPVAAASIDYVKSGANVGIPAGDFVHVAARTTTIFPWLCDNLPVTGPNWLRSVASPGDCLLAAGIAAFLACSGLRMRSLQA